jgi:hypothetical protein
MLLLNAGATDRMRMLACAADRYRSHEFASATDRLHMPITKRILQLA